MNIVPIVFAFDNKLVYPACICLSSLLMNAKPDTFYDIFILHHRHVELKKELLDTVMEYFKNCRIRYREVDNTFDSAFEIREITTPAYYRLLIPQLIPEYDKILYSDVDVIFRDDLFDLYVNTNVDNYYIAGVNSLSHLIPSYKKYYDKMQIDASRVIYSGNLIINSKKILQDNLIDRFKSLAGKKFLFQDMDILNIVCWGKIKYLSPAYCLSTFITEKAVNDRTVLLNIWSEKEIQDALDKGIVHFNGQKPWKGVCINFDIWWEYYRKSPFYNEKYYFDFFQSELNKLDHLTLWKRIKILGRFFIYGRT